MEWVVELKAEGHDALKSPTHRVCPFRKHNEDSILDDPRYANDPKYQKPSASYAALITTSIRSADRQKLTLNDIYEWIMKTFPYYSVGNAGWKVCACVRVCVCACVCVDTTHPIPLLVICPLRVRYPNSP
jgi:hypothetical protein